MFRARDVMQEKFYALTPRMTIAEAIQQFKKATEDEKRRVFGMIVRDETGRLVGMLSMYDVLHLIRPKHAQVWGIMTDVEISGLLEVVAERAEAVEVEDLMTADVITVDPDTHLFHVLDIMIRKHIRRIPVVREGLIQGMVYLSDLFYFFVDHLPQEIGQKSAH